MGAPWIIQMLVLFDANVNKYQSTSRRKQGAEARTVEEISPRSEDTWEAGS
jgi:hypothetical protein